MTDILEDICCCADVYMVVDLRANAVCHNDGDQVGEQQQVA
jgi:hypothetical protein